MNILPMHRGLTNHSRPVTGFFLALLISAIFTRMLGAQSKDWPFSQQPLGTANPHASPSPTPFLASTPPPLATPLRQETWAQLSNTEISRLGTEALALRPQQWGHGETENFVVHYRNFGDALQVAREIEFDLWYVAKSLGAGKDKYARKSHVYAFGDEKEWQDFLEQTKRAAWVHSFAMQDDLFLNVHGTGNGFDSHTLAHETTHAVVSRIYGSRRWPLWLNEGFAEYMGDACHAARLHQQPGLNPSTLRAASMTTTELFALWRYPDDPAEVTELYDTSTKLVRYLFKKYPAELFPKFVDRLLDGAAPADALAEIYGAEFRDMSAFEKRFQTQIR